MKSPVKRIAATAVALLLLGCNRNASETQTAEPALAPTAEATPDAPPPPATPAPIPPSTELPVNSVDSVMLSRPQDVPDSLIIRVLGTAASAGWSEPKLEP